MAKREIDPFEIGRRGLGIPFREFPIWLACALWPFAATIAGEAGHRGTIMIPNWIETPIDWMAMAIFDWCWMTALCRSTVLQLIAFPAARGFWLFLVLNLGLEVLSWLFGSLLTILAAAGFEGYVPFVEWSGIGIQLLGIALAIPAILLGIWVGLRLAIWPAHCVATGTLVRPRVIWRGMADHSFDMLIIGIITAGPALLFVGALFFFGREALSSSDMAMAIKAAATILQVYVSGALDAAMLIAYFSIFAGATASDWKR